MSLIVVGQTGSTAAGSGATTTQEAPAGKTPCGCKGPSMPHTDQKQAEAVMTALYQWGYEDGSNCTRGLRIVNVIAGIFLIVAAVSLIKKVFA